jgi:hypothetical protein
MLTTGQSEQMADDGVTDAKPACAKSTDTKPACVALVPLEEQAARAKTLWRLRPNPTFVTQLIATVEQVPQTRLHRRAAQADALSAYRAGLMRAAGTGFRTRDTSPE